MERRQPNFHLVGLIDSDLAVRKVAEQVAIAQDKCLQRGQNNLFDTDIGRELRCHYNTNLGKQDGELFDVLSHRTKIVSVEPSSERNVVLRDQNFNQDGKAFRNGAAFAYGVIRADREFKGFLPKKSAIQYFSRDHIRPNASFSRGELLSNAHTIISTSRTIFEFFEPEWRGVLSTHGHLVEPSRVRQELTQAGVGWMIGRLTHRWQRQINRKFRKIDILDSLESLDDPEKYDQIFNY